MRSRGATAFGALLFCAVAVCAFAAASASAAGLTAVACKEVAAGTGSYANNHCTTPKVEKSNFETVVIPKNEPKEIEATITRSITGTEHGLGSTANPVAVFHSSTAGIEITTTCGTGNVTGAKLTNEEKGEMQIHIVEAVLTLGECHASPKGKPTKTCTLQGTAPETPVGEVKTNKMTALTGAEHKMAVKPETGGTFTEFKINASGGECFLASAMAVQVTGEAIGVVDTTTHSHLTLNEANQGGTPLRANGAVTTATETVAGFTKGNKEAVIGGETF